VIPLPIKNMWRSLASAALAAAMVACTKDEFPSRAVIHADWNSPRLATLDMSPVELSIKGSYGSTSLTMPKAFLNGSELWRGGEHEELEIEAALPSMAPWSIFGENLFKKMTGSDGAALTGDILRFKSDYDRNFFRDWVSLRLRYGHCYGATNSMPEELAKWGVREQASESNVFEKFKLTRGADNAASIYVPKRQGAHKIYIRCPDNGGDMMRCIGVTDYNSLMSFDIIFSATRLDEYANIEQQARSLLERFAVKSVASGDMPTECREGIR
jgi:hypothetical protein